MRRPGLVAILSLAALLAAGCGTVSVEVTSEDDDDKIDVDRTREATPAADDASVTETTAPATQRTTGRVGGIKTTQLLSQNWQP